MENETIECQRCFIPLEIKNSQQCSNCGAVLCFDCQWHLCDHSDKLITPCGTFFQEQVRSKNQQSRPS